MGVAPSIGSQVTEGGGHDVTACTWLFIIPTILEQIILLRHSDWGTQSGSDLLIIVYHDYEGAPTKSTLQFKCRACT